MVFILCFFKEAVLVNCFAEFLNTINKEQAKKMAIRNGDIDAKHICEFNEDILKILVKSGNKLNLSGLKKITKSNAKILSCGNQKLVLDGLESISPEILSILSGSDRKISLKGIKNISKMQAEELLNYYEVNLDGIEILDPVIANVLSGFKGFRFSLNGIKKIDSISLEKLSGTSRNFLLNGISKLDSNMSKIISNGRAGFSLLNINSISDDCFLTLTNSNSWIHLGLNKMTKEQAFGYRNGSGGGVKIIPTGETVDPVFVESLLIRGLNIDLPHANFINQKIAIMIGGINVRNINLSGLRRINPDLAYWLGMGYGSLNLSGITEIDLTSAEYLSYYIGDLNLSGLKKITPNVADALSRHIGFLDLSGLEELNDISVKKFAGHLGAIDLSSINKISDNSFFLLSQIKNPNIINVILKNNVIMSIKYLFWNYLIFYKIDYYYHYYRITHPSHILLGSLCDFNLVKLFIVILQNHTKISCIDECNEIMFFYFNYNGFKITIK